MKKRCQKLHGTLIAAIMSALVFGLAGCFGGCIEPKNTVWEYVNHHSGEGITILSLKDNSILTEGNVLTLPIEVDGKKVMDFGRLAWTQRTYFNPGTQVEKIIVPDGVPIGEYFWGENIPLVVEFLSENPSHRIPGGVEFDDKIRTLVVPDGASRAYGESLYGPFYRMRIIEKSTYLSQSSD
ncbi:MAG: hypothetical protein FWH03_06855 [Firmicutes bacterium]|nr:hypothetical protein [Bacillota bacterium]